MPYSIYSGVREKFQYFVRDAVRPRGFGDIESVQRLYDEKTVEGKGYLGPFLREVVFGQIEWVVTIWQCPWGCPV